MRYVGLLTGVLLALQLTVGYGHAFWSSEPGSLKELAGGVAAELKEKAVGKKLYLDKANIKDSIGGEASNLSAFLANELESALSASGYSFSDFMEQADLAVGAAYQRDGDKLRIFVKYCPTKGDSGGCRTLAAALPYDRLPRDSFTDSLDNRLNRLVLKAVGNRKGLKVFINPVVERKGRYASEFSEFVTLKSRSALLNSQQFEVLDEQPVTRSLSNTRGLAAKAKDLKNLESSAALFSGADAVLEGYYLEGGGKVTLAMMLKDVKGTLLGSADDTIEKKLIPYSTANATAGALAVVADISGQAEQQMIKLNTTKGDRYQIYRAGEKVQFLIQTLKPLYVYLYGINAKNEVSQLYPGHGQPGRILTSGRVHTVPSDQDSWEIVVEPPFGTDVVKLFASERPLPIPVISEKVSSRSFSEGTRTLVRRDVVQQELSAQKTINGFDLVDYFKGVAARQGVTLYEDSLFVQTRPR